VVGAVRVNKSPSSNKKSRRCRRLLSWFIRLYSTAHWSASGKRYPLPGTMRPPSNARATGPACPARANRTFHGRLHLIEGRTSIAARSIARHAELSAARSPGHRISRPNAAPRRRSGVPEGSSTPIAAVQRRARRLSNSSCSAMMVLVGHESPGISKAVCHSRLRPYLADSGRLSEASPLDGGSCSTTSGSDHAETASGNHETFT